MRLLRLLLLTLYLSLFNFMAISAFVGDNGLIAYSELNKYKIRLSNNLENLREINERLRENCKSMEKDEQMILYARSLGMVDKKESVLILEDFSHLNNYDLGSRYSSNIKTQNRVFNVNNIRFISFFLAVIFVALVAVAKKGTNDNKKRKSERIEDCIPDIAQ